MLNQNNRKTLLNIARRSIEYGLDQGQPLPVDPSDYPPELQALGASFVTLKKHGELRGCIGILEAVDPLVVDVAKHAFAAAFLDNRFAPVRAEELPDITLSISVLGEPEPIYFYDEADLLRQLRPNVDGLILEEGGRRATFLPSVWEQLPNPREFVRHLKRKAGLPDDYWSDQIRFYRYGSESFGEDDVDATPE